MNYETYVDHSRLVKGEFTTEREILDRGKLEPGNKIDLPTHGGCIITLADGTKLTFETSEWATVEVEKV